MKRALAQRLDRAVRIALAGCGRIAGKHIASIVQNHDRARLVALCDPLDERLEAASALLVTQAAEADLLIEPPARFSSFAELLAGDHGADLVVLATPSGLHAQQAIAAAEAGYHVMSEKPMATRWADGQAMVKACDRAGVRLFVVKQNRFNSTIQLVKRQLEAGRFGRLAMVTANVFWSRPQAYYDKDAWRGTWEYDGGALMNQASHYVDLLDWLIGPVQSVSASMATIGRRIEVEDTAALQLRWRNGCLGTMAVTVLTYPRDLEGSITILGESGSVRVAGAALNRISHWQFADPHPDDDAVEEAGYEPSSVYGFGHPPYYANVLAALRGEGEALCDGREGLRSLELLIGAYRSARDGVTTHLPLDF
ncbi:MAG: Gfo/Idh/MocA family oxidoreductase [Synechococcaceae cyanobacterium]|nr:Gfo/Idh/MocA family oxidoreductase [Synechococcaceae cyanobacterium]